MFSIRSILPFSPLSSATRLALTTMAMPETPPENRLGREKSPYLQQHAHNPIDWFPWGDDAFAKAHQENRLIFLSIGYSTCHWCHVMEHESFSDQEVADLLNRDFVAIKVDREERPDIDRFYMQVCVTLTGSGGWPLTIIMTPDKVPVFAGTYLPKAQRYNRPGLMNLLPRAQAAWRENPQGLQAGGNDLISKMQRLAKGTPGKEEFSLDLLHAAEKTLRKSFDAVNGGFGPAPKFPSPHNLRFLMQHAHRNGDRELLQMATFTLEKMRNGGLYDHLGFGVHRYSTDQRWLLPHFEKMLYDQAGLAQSYLEAWQLTGREEFANTAREIFNYVLRDLHDPRGGFYSAEDADSEGVEGLFYVWCKAEISRILGSERGERFARIYRVTAAGNYADEATGKPTGDNILHLSKPLSAWAEELSTPLDALEKELEQDRRALFEEREKRIRPFRDDKVLTAWNGMMISALACGGRILDAPEYSAAASAAADFILEQMRDEQGNLLRRWRQGEAAIQGFADDYAFLAQGLLDLYRASYETKRLEQAIDLAERLYQNFSDQQGRIYDTPPEHDLPLRTSELYDGATPSAGSMALNLFAQLFRLTGQPIWQERAQALINVSTSEVARYPAGYCQFLIGASRLLEPGKELLIVGDPAASDTRALLKAVDKLYSPELTVLLRDSEQPGSIDRLAPFARGMETVNGLATAYLCEDFCCQKPLTDAEELHELLSDRKG